MPANLDQLTCPGCGYALRGLPDNICPECGRAFDADLLLSCLPDSNAIARAMSAAVTAIVTGGLSLPATMVVGLQIVQPDCYGCCRPAVTGEELLLFVTFVGTLIVPCITGCVAACSRAATPKSRRMAIIGWLAAITSWATLFVILSCPL